MPLRSIHDPVPSPSKKKRKHKSPSSDDSKSASQSSASSSSSSSSSGSDSDSDSDSDDSVSSVDSDDLDHRALKLKPRSAAFQAAHSQTLLFTGQGLQDLSDTAIVYRATNRLTVPLGQNQAPCGKCPQFAFCEENGPVNADSCEYYGNWLDDAVGGWDAEAKLRYHPPVVEEEAEEEVDEAEEGVAEPNGTQGDELVEEDMIELDDLGDEFKMDD